ncbi:MAG TPA: hypothetical protein VE685_17885 [Thermoanaerobaculia bacterium]|nr:hypothetical protein [Thermoanaerobaculia bacterium]
MYRIEETSYGYRVKFEGHLQRDDAGALLTEVKAVIRPRGAAFAVLMDLRSSRALPAETQDILRATIVHFREAGMERNACVLDSAIAALQARRLAREAGVADGTRTIDVSHQPDWERVALDWLVRAIDPDLN